MIATLRTRALFHWESEQARKLAGQLYRTFSAYSYGRRTDRAFLCDTVRNR